MSDRQYPSHPQRNASYAYPAYYGYPSHPPVVHHATQAALTGAMVGAMVGAAKVAHAPGTPSGRAVAVGQSAFREATRFGLATGLGAAVASLVPGGALLRGAAMVATGALVLAAQDGKPAALEADDAEAKAEEG